MIDAEQLAELQGVFPGASAKLEAGYNFVHIPKLTLPEGCQPHEVKALLCPQARDGYTTRLFLSQPVAGKGSNWTQHHILGYTWHTRSWQNVGADQRLIQILLGHLGALQ
jgi:hypothetical protein